MINMLTIFEGWILPGLGVLGFHLWTSTLFLLLCLMAVWAGGRILSAGACSTLLTAAFVKFLVPAALLLAPLRALGVDFSLLRAQPPFHGAFRILAPGGIVLPPQHPGLPARLWVCGAIWLIVTTVLIWRLFRSSRSVALIATRDASGPHRRELDALHRAAAAVGLRREISLLRAPLRQAPAVVGIRSTMLILPSSGCDDLTDPELEALLRHECAHVRRRDNLVIRVESILCALFWFNPFLWIAQHLAAVERERACDELAAETPVQRTIYLSALANFCRSAVAPSLPGISCMATAHLKERMDHLMTYETLQRRTPSPRFIAITACSALVLFTLVSGAMSTTSAAAATHGISDDPYEISFILHRLPGGADQIDCTITDKATGQLISSPLMTFQEGQPASLSSDDDGRKIEIHVYPAADHDVSAHIEIRQDGKVVQDNVVLMSLSPAKPHYTGETIDLRLKDAEITDVLRLFGQLTKKTISIDSTIKGKVTVDWNNIPWDQALAQILEQQHLASRVDGNTIYIFPR